MATEKNGIAVAGTLLVDKINEISAYPNCGELTKILSIKTAVGGCVPNVAIDLKKICPTLNVFAIGKIGNDQEGNYIKDVLIENKINTDHIMLAKNTKTSFTDVMSVSGGQRTFFTFAGADNGLTAADIDFKNLNCKILHLGYFLLLEKIDKGEGISILKHATENGIETAIDLVSENSNRYSLVRPCLPFTDYLIVNETEAGKLADIPYSREKALDICKKLKEMGVRKKIIIHCPEYAICYSDSGMTVVGSFIVPKDFIVGTTGAGDAFCAAALYAIYCGKEDKDILEFASAAAVTSLRQADATSGLCTEEEILRFCKNFERNKKC